MHVCVNFHFFWETREIRVNEERRLNSGGQREEKSRWQRTPPRICRVRVLGLGDSGWPLHKRERSETGVSLGRQTTGIELKMGDLLQIGKVEVRPQISLPTLSKRQMTAKPKARKIEKLPKVLWRAYIVKSILLATCQFYWIKILVLSFT